MKKNQKEETRVPLLTYNIRLSCRLSLVAIQFPFLQLFLPLSSLERKYFFSTPVRVAEGGEMSTTFSFSSFQMYSNYVFHLFENHFTRCRRVVIKQKGWESTKDVELLIKNVFNLERQPSGVAP